jgi:chemotaxis protein methyltransferase CheR
MTSGDSLRHRLTVQTGIELVRGGLSDSLKIFVERRLKELSLKDEPAYLSHLDDEASGEAVRLIEVISVPHTWFFRDPVQLSAIIDALSERKGRGTPLSVWVPGCATGEDAYSIALLADAAGLEVQVTASDISLKSLERGREATYGSFSLREVPAHFLSELEPLGTAHRVSERIRAMVRFQEHNLMDPAIRTRGGWDIILCRNVFIYFSAENACLCAEALSQVLSPDGTLFWGAGELLTQSPRGVYPVSIRDRIAFRRLPTSPRLEGDRTHVPPARLVLTVSAPVEVAPSLGEFPQNAGKMSRDPPPSPDWEELLAREDIGSATQEVLRLSAALPLDMELRTGAGIFLYSLGDYELALREFRAALMLDPRLWFVALYEGLCLDGLGRRDEARDRFRAAERWLLSGGDSIALPEVLKGHGADLREMVKAKARAST